MDENTIKNYDSKVKKLPSSMIEIAASIPAPEFDATRSEALKHIGADVELPGFRKGHVPEKILSAKVGEAAILEEMAEIAIGKAYPAIVLSEKLDVLGRPEVRITKIALGNPLEFIITTAVFPEINLPDYKKLAKSASGGKDEVAVTDEELDKTIEQIRRARTKSENKSDLPDEAKEEELPALTDDYVKTLGDFASVGDFKSKLKENMLKEKAREAKDKKRIAIMEAIVREATIDLPEIITEQELARLEDEFSHDIERMGLTMDNYLKATSKTKEDMRKEWRPDAEKRAKVQLIVSKIAELENLEPSAEILKKEVASLCARYPDASEERAEGYMRMILTNEKVFELLENPA